jgi:hypothetical protein
MCIHAGNATGISPRRARTLATANSTPRTPPIAERTKRLLERRRDGVQFGLCLIQRAARRQAGDDAVEAMVAELVPPLACLLRNQWRPAIAKPTVSSTVEDPEPRPTPDSPDMRQASTRRQWRRGQNPTCSCTANDRGGPSIT